VSHAYLRPYMHCPMPATIAATTGDYPDRTTARLSFDVADDIDVAAMCFLHCHAWDETLRHWVPVEVQREPV
jgi:hypothetical protein